MKEKSLSQCEWNYIRTRKNSKIEIKRIQEFVMEFHFELLSGIVSAAVWRRNGGNYESL